MPAALVINLWVYTFPCHAYNMLFVVGCVRGVYVFSNIIIMIFLSYCAGSVNLIFTDTADRPCTSICNHHCAVQDVKWKVPIFSILAAQFNQT